MTIDDGVANLSNGAHLSYLDTGIPEGVSNYRTFIFIHGAAHNKCKAIPSPTDLVSWEPLLEATPKGIRGIAFSQRGFKGSTPLTPDEIACTVPPSQLARTHISDFASFIEFVGEKLNVTKRSSDGTGGITLVSWSKGCASITGLFYFQKETPSYKDLIDKYISSVVLYEPPTSAVIGIDPGECSNALFYSRLAAPPEDPAFMFAKYVTGFYRHSPEYLSNKGGKQVTEYYRAGALEPDFQKYSAKVFEGEHMQSILHWSLTDDQAERYEACHEAFQEMAKSSLKRVGIMWGSEGPPECLEGSWIGEKWLKEEEGKTGEQKVLTKQFEGGNHYIQFYDVQGFWKSILELSV
jgi:pimeloyl-ACP methyl ester carboxylesterase